MTIESSTTGLSLSDATLGDTLYRLTVSGAETAVVSSDSTPVLRSASLLGSVWGVNNLSPASAVDARESWWGAADGPSGAGAGSGSAVTAGVLFDPWRATPPGPAVVPMLSRGALAALTLVLAGVAAWLLRRRGGSRG